MKKPDITHAGTPVVPRERTVSELMKVIDYICGSINRITNTTASLRATSLTAEQSQFVRKLEREAHDLAVELARINTELNVKQNTQNTENQSNKNQSSIAGASILLVEDDLIIRTVGINILKRNGANVTIAENGMIATELIAGKTFDIILMDIQMPVMNGFDATRIIRQEHKCTTPIIGLTANAVQNAEEQYYDAGMNDVMSKPYNQDTLVAIIDKWLNNKVINKIEDTNETETTSNSLFSLSKLRDIGDEEFVKRMLQLFIGQVSPSVSAIRKAYNDKDFPTIKYIAHRIRPSILNMGIDCLKQEVTEIEQLANTNESSIQLDQMISKLETVMEQVTAQIRQVLDK